MTDLARRYADALANGDLEAAATCWAIDGDGKARVLGLPPVGAPAGLFASVDRWRAARPDATLELTELHDDGSSEQAVAVWRLTAPQTPALELELCDLLRVRDGAIDRSNVVYDCSLLACQLGGPPDWIAGEPEPVADGVWVLRGGYPLRSMNVYLIEDAGGVTVFDTGTRAMGAAIRQAADELGGARRAILGHAHSDHRGGAAALGVPVYCHPRELADAEGDGGMHYMDTEKIAAPARWVMPALMRAYDGPPVSIAGTLSEGDTVAGFTVIDLPGHSPGLIGLWREADRLALVTDCVYLSDVDALGKPGPARVPHPATSFDTEQAAASIRKLAALEPAAVWPGHMGPITGDVRAQLERAARG